MSEQIKAGDRFHDAGHGNVTATGQYRGHFAGTQYECLDAGGETRWYFLQDWTRLPAPAKPTPRAGQRWRCKGGCAHTLATAGPYDWSCTDGSWLMKSWLADGTATLIRDVEEKAPEPWTTEEDILAIKPLNATAADQARESTEPSTLVYHEGGSMKIRLSSGKVIDCGTPTPTEAEIVASMTAINASYQESERQRRDKEAIAAAWRAPMATWASGPLCGLRGGR